MSQHPDGDPLMSMFGHVSQLPDQIEASGSCVPALEPLESRPRQIWLCGMGGSAVAGELLGSCSGFELPELRVHRGYGLPPSEPADTLFVFSSYSGDTEEVLSAHDAWRALGSPGHALVLCSGGELAARAADDQIAIVRLPGGLPPRAALGWSLGGLLRALDGLGLATGAADGMAEAVQLLRDRAASLEPEAEPAANPARRLARLLYGKLVLLYAGSPLTVAVAWRWKAQINENAKSLAYVSSLPEHNHNEITAFLAASGLPQNCFVVGLRDASEHRRVHRRFEASREILAAYVHAFEDVESHGRSDFARMLSLVQLGDYASLYLAEAYGVDPRAIEVIERLKNSLQG